MNKYENPIILKNKQGVSYYKAKRFPNIPLSESDIYLICQQGDRLDQLALQYYKDENLYWVISISNNLKTDSLFLEPGSQIRIPLNITEILKLFNDTNF